MKKLVAALLAILPLAVGCQATAPTAAAPTAAVQAEGPAPRPISAAQVRHLLAADSGATLWGINYSQHQSRSYSRRSGSTVVFTGNAAFSGRGQLVRADYNRYVYQVPDNQVLILNKDAGGPVDKGCGSFALNGFGVYADATPIHYLYGPGELVVINFSPAQSYAYNNDSSGYTNYYGLSISGYTADPKALAGLGALSDAK